MATDVLDHDLRENPQGTGVPVHLSAHKLTCLERDLRFAEVLPAATEVIALHDIPAGFIVLTCEAEVLTAVSSPASGVTLHIGDCTPLTDSDTAGSTVTVGDLDGYFASIDVHTAAKQAHLAGAYNAVCKQYAARAILTAQVIGDAPVNGVVRVALWGYLGNPNTVRQN